MCPIAPILLAISGSLTHGQDISYLDTLYSTKWIRITSNEDDRYFIDQVDFTHHYSITFLRPAQVFEKWVVVSGPFLVEPNNELTYSDEVRAVGDDMILKSKGDIQRKYTCQRNSLPSNVPTSKSTQLITMRSDDSCRSVFVVCKEINIVTATMSIRAYTGESMSVVYRKK